MTGEDLPVEVRPVEEVRLVVVVGDERDPSAGERRSGRVSGLDSEDLRSGGVHHSILTSPGVRAVTTG
ncbi:MAG: hypothetical protein M5U14_03990 [Acidimicrobiia bacterium]|nr:hypothetical protein [Acidimicrobiia bacterium]